MKFFFGISTMMVCLLAYADAQMPNNYNGYHIGRLFETVAQRNALDAARKPIDEIKNTALSYQWNGVVIRQQHHNRYIYQDVSAAWINQQKLQSPAQQQSIDAQVAADFSHPLRLQLSTQTHSQHLKPGDTWQIPLLPKTGSSNAQ